MQTVCVWREWQLACTVSLYIYTCVLSLPFHFHYPVCIQNTNPAVQGEGGSSRAYNVISVVVEPSSASIATESFSATSSPSTGMANQRMLALDDISHTSSGMDLGIDPSFSTCSNEAPLEASGKTTPASISALVRCASQDSGMA